MHVLFGNASPKEAPLGLADASSAELPEGVEGAAEESVTLFTVPDTDGLIEQVLPTITKVWAQSHSDSPPTWVASDNDGAAAMLAVNYRAPVKDVHEAMSLYRKLDVMPEPAVGPSIEGGQS